MTEQTWQTYLNAVAAVKTTRDPKEAVRLIQEHRLPREVLPTELLNSKDVWAALLESMPATALIRNLAKLTRVGVIAPMSDGTKLAVSKLSDGAWLRKARVHPITVLLALKTYASGRTQATHGPSALAHNWRTLAGRSKSGGIMQDRTWEPESQIIDVLDAAFYEAFASVEPAGKRTLVALDVSGSMNVSIPGGMMSCTEAGAAMSLVLASTEPDVHTIVFHTVAQSFPISKKQRLDDVLKAARRFSGGTDVAQPMLYAQARNLKVDTFVILTDNETWAGNTHPQAALERYRQVSGINARSVVLSAAANTVTVADPKDPLVFNIVGFDSNAPQLVNMFSRGEI